MWKTVKTKEEAYTLFNNFSYKHGFGIRIGKVYTRNEKITVTSREFLCDKNGLKKDKQGVGKKYTKSDTRTGCPARLKFRVQKDGNLMVIVHDMVHNHGMVPLHLRHFIHSHRKIGRQAIATVSALKSSGVGVATSYQGVLKPLVFIVSTLSA